MLSTTIQRAGGNLVDGTIAARASGFGRLFPSLLGWVPPGETREQQVSALYELSEALYAPRPAPPDRDGIPAGYTYLAQLVTHDLSFDARNVPLDPSQARSNLRTPALDLDAVYGLGPELQPHLYQETDPRQLLIGATDGGELDLPRVRDQRVPRRSPQSVYRRQRAVIPDPRDDENLIVAQLHLAVMRFHNRCVQDGASFDDARRQTRWHYQWLVVNDLLVRLCGADVVADALGRRGVPNLTLLPPLSPPFVPLEFAVGAFRAGHSMIRASYVLNDHFEGVFGAAGYPIFDPLTPAHSLIGGREVPIDWAIQWDRFFPPADGVAGAACQRAQRIGPFIDPTLRALPIDVDDARFRSLSFRTLVRAWQLGLPSGQSVAEAVTGRRPAGNDPLWLFVLGEAADAHAGARLGPVAARIVAEVIVGLLKADHGSYYATQSDWEPAAAARAGRRYTVLDFLRAAGVPVDARSWAGRKQ